MNSNGDQSILIDSYSHDVVILHKLSHALKMYEPKSLNAGSNVIVV